MGGWVIGWVGGGRSGWVGEWAGWQGNGGALQLAEDSFALLRECHLFRNNASVHTNSACTPHVWKHQLRALLTKQAWQGRGGAINLATSSASAALISSCVVNNQVPFPEKSVQSSICISTGMGRGCNFIVCHKSQAFAVQRGYKLRGIVNLLCFMALDLSDVQPFVILNNEKANTAVLLEDTTLNAGLHHYSMCNTDRQPRQAPNNALETPPIALRLENGAQAFLTRTHFVDCKVKRTEGAKAYLVHRNSSFVPEIRSSSASKRLAWSLTSV